MKVTSTIFSEMHGRLAGTTFVTNGNGIVAKVATPPSNPNSDRQVMARNALADCGTLWASLTPQQREAWRQSAHLHGWGDLGSGSAKTWNYFVYCMSQNLYMIKREFVSTVFINPTGSESADSIGFGDMGYQGLEGTYGITVGAYLQSTSGDDSTAYVWFRRTPAFLPTRNYCPGGWMSSKDDVATLVGQLPPLSVADDLTITFEEGDVGKAVWVDIHGIIVYKPGTSARIQSFPPYWVRCLVEEGQPAKKGGKKAILTPATVVEKPKQVKAAA